MRSPAHTEPSSSGFRSKNYARSTAWRERGIRTYVLSNNNPSSMRFIRAMFTADGKRMEDYFDGIYLSYEMRELKPSEAIFRKMIADSGMLPERTLYIDDGQKNVDAGTGTRVCGLQTRSGRGFRTPARQRGAAVIQGVFTQTCTFHVQKFAGAGKSRYLCIICSETASDPGRGRTESGPEKEIGAGGESGSGREIGAEKIRGVAQSG